MLWVQYFAKTDRMGVVEKLSYDGNLSKQMPLEPSYICFFFLRKSECNYTYKKWKKFFTDPIYCLTIHKHNISCMQLKWQGLYYIAS